MEITCLKINELNESICESNLKVKYMLLNEKANFINRKNKVIHEQDILEASPQRKKVICPIFYECGGCDFLHVKYLEQLRMKSDYLHKLFQRYQIMTPILSIMKSDVPLNYRHKIVASATTKNNKLRLGLFQENSKNIIPFLDCHIQDLEANEVLKTLEMLFNKYKLPAYDLSSGKGMIKHVLIRKSFYEKTMLVAIVTQDWLLPNAKKIASELVSTHPKIQTIIQNIHHKKTRQVLLDEEKIIYGKGSIEDQIDNVRFRLSSKSFYQVNPVQMIALYKKAIELADIKPNDVVIDTYSGIGTISLLVANKAKQVIAIETNQSAHLDALNNKKINNITNVNFVNDDVEKYLMSYHGQVDKLIMDPTRDGASEGFLNAVLMLKPKKIVYISCEPKTQLRDLMKLKEKYSIDVIQPVDMFSQTVHIEIIALLTSI